MNKQCESCGVADESLLEDRGHQICGWCYQHWRRREKYAGYPLSWEKFTAVGLLILKKTARQKIMVSLQTP